MQTPSSRDATHLKRSNDPPRPERADGEPALGEAAPAFTARYRLFSEIARGGMGAVLHAHDPRLGRDLAVKVLLEEHAGNPEMLQRFLEEAQIGGQLQHPGIVPVYDIGHFNEERPFFTMKLVRGQTLAPLLSQRPSDRADLPRWLQVFEQVCQTVAYAHSKGVIHRDLKPANVMVGAFGEVQVMDWGLAKVLRPAAEGKAGEVRTVRTCPGGTESQVGLVLGTPACMAPEQARGGEVDERADVFGLGGILCEILTGQPPYVGASRTESFHLAAGGELSEAHGRLARCGADRELVLLAQDCLAPAPGDRPRNAGEVAARMAAYQAGVQERLRRTELQRAAAEARARAEWRARRLTGGLAVALLLLAGLGGAAAWQGQQRRQATRHEVETLLGRAATLAEQAQAG
jgi:serine/threonine-protein kinase